MEFIKDHAVNPCELGIVLESTQEEPIRHRFDPRARGALVLVPHGIAHALSKWFFQADGEPGCCSPRGKSPGLKH